MTSKKKKRTVMIFGFLLLGLSIGYAYLNTTLNINGTTNVHSNTWDVYWDNVQVTSGSVNAETPEIDTAKTTVSFEVDLDKPGDFYEFTVDAKNDGSVDAMIDTITSKLNGVEITTLPNYLDYSVTYEDDMDIEVKQLLKANEKETIKVRVAYKTDINPSDLPSTSQTLTFQFGEGYVQADNTATKVRNYVYVFLLSRHYTYSGESVNSLGTSIYDSPGELIAREGYYYFARYLIKNDIVVSTDLGFALSTPEVGPYYYIKGGDGGASYEKNIQILREAFGESNCSFENDGNTYSCNHNTPVLRAVVHSNGVTSLIGGWSCDQNITGGTRCSND